MNPLHDSAARSAESYLQATVATASPARLRLMLIERSIEVAARLADRWRHGANENESGRGGDELVLRLFELLNELLSGVTGHGEVGLNRQVADLYVFLIQHLLQAETRRDPAAVDEIRTVLQVEAETWRLVCAREAGAPRPHADLRGGAAVGGLNVEA